VSVAVSVSLSGVTCDEYSNAEEAILITALASTLAGVEESDIGPTTCDDGGYDDYSMQYAASIDVPAVMPELSPTPAPYDDSSSDDSMAYRRLFDGAEGVGGDAEVFGGTDDAADRLVIRELLELRVLDLGRLLSGSVWISFEITVVSISASDTPTSVADAISTLLAAAVSAGTLASNIGTAASDAGYASVIAAATVTGTSAVAVTDAPTALPTYARTVLPTPLPTILPTASPSILPTAPRLTQGVHLYVNGDLVRSEDVQLPPLAPDGRWEDRFVVDIGRASDGEVVKAKWAGAVFGGLPVRADPKDACDRGERISILVVVWVSRVFIVVGGLCFVFAVKDNDDCCCRPFLFCIVLIGILALWLADAAQNECGDWKEIREAKWTYMRGHVDEVVIYDRALEPEEIAELASTSAMTGSWWDLVEHKDDI